MKIYSLSGPSGTGKSTSALELAFTYQIDAIIDDGLLIVNGQKLAGVSAKFEKNSITAVRRAIFSEEGHCQEVMNALKETPIHSILLIGTSRKMTKKIAERLQLGDIDTFIDVTEIRSQKEIEQAKFIRRTQGKHVMPIPHLQVEQNFFQRLIRKGREIFLNAQKIGETTIVQPDFHQEIIEISRNVYVSVIQHELERNAYVAKSDITQLNIEMIPQMDITLYLKSPVQYVVCDEMYLLQKQISEAFLLHFGIEPESIQLHVKGVK